MDYRKHKTARVQSTISNNPSNQIYDTATISNNVNHNNTVTSEYPYSYTQNSNIISNLETNTSSQIPNFNHIQQSNTHNFNSKSEINDLHGHFYNMSLQSQPRSSTLYNSHSNYEVASNFTNSSPKTPILSESIAPNEISSQYQYNQNINAVHNVNNSLLNVNDNINYYPYENNITSNIHAKSVQDSSTRSNEYIYSGRDSYSNAIPPQTNHSNQQYMNGMLYQPPVSTQPTHMPSNMPQNRINYQHQNYIPNPTLPKPDNIPTYSSNHPINFNTHSSSSQSSGGFSDNMPNPIIAQKNLNEMFKGVTIRCQQYSELPPPCSIECFYKDEGVANPRYMRSTHYMIPSTNKIAKNIKIPLGVVVQPFAELHIRDTPIMSSYQGSHGPQRCEQCRAYVNPQSVFIDGGKTLVCNICRHKTPVVDSYFCYLDNSGSRLDRFSRPELFQGSYEMSTNNLYCRNNTPPKPPLYIFMFNVSRNSITNGMIAVVADIISSIIPQHLAKDSQFIDTPPDNDRESSTSSFVASYENVPFNNKAPSNDVDSRKKCVRVAFMAYDKRIYYFNIREHSNNRHFIEISLDINDPYIPSYRGFVVDPYDCSNQIQCLLQEIPKLFANTTVIDTILGPVIESAVSLIKNNGDCGRLFIFHSILPNYNAAGKLENRDNNPHFCTENEMNILKPNGNYYSKLANECVINGISVNLFLTTSGFVDIATLGSLCDITGGRIFYYPFFDPKHFGQQLASDIKNLLTRQCGHDIFMKLRASNGLRVSSMYGCFSFASATDIQLAYIDSDTTIAIELEHDEDLKSSSPMVSLQLAILYTSLSGQRRLRVHNIYLKHSDDHMNIYRSLDCEAIICLLTKKYCCEMMKQNSVTFVGDKLSEYTYAPLLFYVKHCKQSQSHIQQLILPESLKLYPLYMNALIKSDAFLSRRELGQDGRSVAILRFKLLSLSDLFLELYPSLYNIFDPINNQTIEELNEKTSSLSELGIPTYRCLYEKLQADQIYLLVLPHLLFLWIGSRVDQESLRNLFGVCSLEQIDNVVMEMLPAFDNLLSNSTRQLINLVRKHHHKNRFLPISIVKQGGLTEGTFRHFLSESKSSKPKSFSYMEYLCFIHKSINDRL